MTSAVRISCLRNAWLGVVLFAFAGLSSPAWADPPALVARMDRFQGTATLLPAGSTSWSYANINRPLSTGDQVWIGAASRAELVAGSTAMRMGANTSLSLLELSDAAIQLKLTQGIFEVRVRQSMRGRSFEIDTPNLAFDLQTPGDYRVNVNPRQGTTTVIVRAGRGMAYGAGGTSYPVAGRQMVQFSGNALRPDAGAFNPPFDGFDRWVAMLNRREDDSLSARYLGIGMTGYQGLDEYGRWESDPAYGPVWVPTAVPAGWAPYHDGHWAWIAPWGWTWIDDEPWGFAPFHYGRWAYLGSVWAWVPGPVIVRPVYAPALVAFVGGGGGGVRWGVSLAIGSPGIAWFPLAPGEIYRPVYASSPAYVNAINRTVIINRNVTIVHNTTVVNNVQRTVYVNQGVPGAVTAVPAAAFVRGRAVQRVAVPLRAEQVAAATVRFSPPIAPVRQSVAGHRAAAAPPRAAFERPVLATRTPPPPLHDTLAQRLAARDGTAPGAGRPLLSPDPARLGQFQPARRVQVIPVPGRVGQGARRHRPPLSREHAPLARQRPENPALARAAFPGAQGERGVPHPPMIGHAAHLEGGLVASPPRLPPPEYGRNGVAKESAQPSQPPYRGRQPREFRAAGVAHPRPVPERQHVAHPPAHGPGLAHRPESRPEPERHAAARGPRSLP